jgi:hypothetical protein
MLWSMITLGGMSKACESYDKTKRQSIFGLHSQAENALEYDHAGRNVQSV